MEDFEPLQIAVPVREVDFGHKLLTQRTVSVFGDQIGMVVACQFVMKMFESFRISGWAAGRLRAGLGGYSRLVAGGERFAMGCR